MKVFFNASLAGKLQHPDEYKKVSDIVKKLGHIIITSHITQRNYKIVNKQNLNQHARDFQIIRENIRKSDVVIAEATYPSIGVGYLIGLALEMYKPVLILYLSTPHGLLLGDPNRLLSIARYSLENGEKLKKIIKTFLRKAKDKMLKYKFNLILNKSQDYYLETFSKENRISKAQLIRNLIDKEFKKT